MSLRKYNVCGRNVCVRRDKIRNEYVEDQSKVVYLNKKIQESR